MFRRNKPADPALEGVIPFPTEPRRVVSPRVEPKMIQAIPFSPNWLPFPAAAPAQKSPSAPLDQERDAADAQPLPVIVAEDDPVSRMLVCTLLEKWGYRVIVTNDGREAMEAIRAQTTPALAVIDWMMPGMDGIELCQRVREANKILYIILLTARGGKERLIEGLEAGADDYLMKPFDKDELRARLRVGARIIALHMSLAARVEELEAAAFEIQSLKLQLPI